MLKQSDNPPMLCPWVDDISEFTGHWWIAHTKSRQEKAFAWDLHAQGVGYFLPLQERIIFSGGRKRRVQKPLFPSYVFACGSEGARQAVLKTNRLCQLIPVADPNEFVAELSAFCRVLAQGAVVQHFPNVVEGSVCRITSGPFRGLEGPVIRIRNKSSVFLRISAIAQGALVEVESGLLEHVH